MVHVGEKIEKARKIKRLTQGKLAQMIGVSDKSVSSYESGRINPPLHILEKIATSTDQTMSYFLEESIHSEILARLKEIQNQFKEIKTLLEKKM